MFHVKLPVIIMALTVVLLICGCGEKTITGTVVSKQEDAQRCIDCHGAVSRVTGMSIAEEWQRSGHNTRNAASCADCHEPHQSHPDAGNCIRCHGGSPLSGPDVAVDADAAGKCAKCHTQKGGFGVTIFNGKTRNTITSHFNNTSSSYVSSRNIGKCKNCHNPHDTSSSIATLRAWARSGHGRTGAGPWNQNDFKTLNECNRCHTTTGFIKYLSTGDFQSWGNVTDKTKEMLGCNACHIDYAYRLRTAGQVTAKYDGGSVTFPDIGTSNLCLNCHSGRKSGASVSTLSNYTSASFVNSHYLAAGGIVFGEIGYEYVGRNYADLAFYRHRYIGTSNALGASVVASTSGPCVGCHLANKSQPGEKHTLKSYIGSGTLLSPTCTTSSDCHGAKPTGSPADDRTLLDVTWMPRYQMALTALKYYLANNAYRKLFYSDSSPFYYIDTNGDGVLSASETVSTNSQKKWHSLGGPEADNAVSGKNNMGAAFNYNLLKHDRGGVIHNRYYTRRLIYDSIDWLDDNLLNNSVGSSLNALSGVGDTEFKVEAMKYLIKTKSDKVTFDIGPSERF